MGYSLWHDLIEISVDLSAIRLPSPIPDIATFELFILRCASFAKRVVTKFNWDAESKIARQRTKAPNLFFTKTIAVASKMLAPRDVTIISAVELDETRFDCDATWGGSNAVVGCNADSWAWALLTCRSVDNGSMFHIAVTTGRDLHLTLCGLSSNSLDTN